jgi:primase-polymerase (primpol)-like protein
MDNTALAYVEPAAPNKVMGGLLRNSYQPKIKSATASDTANIPDTVKSLQFCLWYSKTVGDKIKKIPCGPDGVLLDVSKGQGYSYDAVVARYEADEAFPSGASPAGIGLVLQDKDGVTAIDFDSCLDPLTGKIEPAAQALIDELNTYCEVSPSGGGVRILVRGNTPGRINYRTPEWTPTLHTKTAGIEAYSHGGYVTLTGNRGLVPLPR